LVLGLTHPPSQWVPGFFPVGKGDGAWHDHSPPSVSLHVFPYLCACEWNFVFGVLRWHCPCAIWHEMDKCAIWYIFKIVYPISYVKVFHWLYPLMCVFFCILEKELYIS
jgi:hypothetical protein